MNLRVLIVDEMHESIVPLLEEIGCEADYRPKVKRDEVKSIIKFYDGLIVRSKIRIDRELIGLAENLKFVGRAGAGLETLDVTELQRRNIQVINAPEGNRDALAEHATGMLLSLMHNIVRSHMQVNEKMWNRRENRGFELMSKTVGIVGYGFMGEAFADRLTGFGCEVLAYDKYREKPFAPHVKRVELAVLFENTDILSIHLPLTIETRHMIDREFFDNFKKSIYVLNTSRGGIVDQEALVDNLKTGKIIGAALDVLENEKLGTHDFCEREIFNYLTHAENVVITPHIAGWTHESYRKINEVIVRKIKKIIFE